MAIRHKLSRASTNYDLRGFILPIICLMAVFLVAGSLQLSEALFGDHSLHSNGRGDDPINQGDKNEVVDNPSEKDSSDSQPALPQPTPPANDTALSSRMRQHIPRTIPNKHQKVELDPFKCTRMRVNHLSMSEPIPMNESQKDLWYVCR